jgi:aspartyl-tRNA(Asn)/glutamyl-tRNA(Gln) amidotransferase subunit A
VFGIKPTFLRISRTGNLFQGTVGHTGPIGASTEDLVSFLGVVATDRDVNDPIQSYAPDGAEVFDAWRRSLGRGVRGCRIGVPSREWRDADPAIAMRGMDALSALEREGARLVEIDIPLAEHSSAIGVLTIGPECSGSMTDDLAQYGDQMSDDFVLTLHLLSHMSANEFVMAQRARAALRKSAAQVLRTVDLFALPSVAGHAPMYPLSEDGVAVSDPEVQIKLLRYSFLANLTVLPACSVPVGRDGNHPIGLQLVADAWDEASVFSVMAHLERMGVIELAQPVGRFDLLGERS